MALQSFPSLSHSSLELQQKQQSFDLSHSASGLVHIHFGEAFFSLFTTFLLFFSRFFDALDSGQSSRGQSSHFIASLPLILILFQSAFNGQTSIQSHGQSSGLGIFGQLNGGFIATLPR